MRPSKKTFVPIAVLAILVGASCLPNPEGPVLVPPGEVLLYDANFNSIQMNGDFSGVSWDPLSARNELTLVADNSWEITASLNESDLADGAIQFKFTHDNNWAPDNFGAGGSLGEAVLEGGPDNITLPLSVDPGFYTFTFDDESFRYSTMPAAAIGSLGGSLSFDGPAPDEGAEISLWAEHADGPLELWGLADVEGDFSFTGLADSIYALRASAPGYGSQILSGIRVESGSADAQAFLLAQVFGAISGTVSFEDVAAAPFPEAIVVAFERTTQLEAGRDTSDVANGAYLVAGLSGADYDLRFSAPGYIVATLDSIHVAGDAEVPGQDIMLAATDAATPDQPWFTAIVDGSIDAGFDADLSDPVGDSDWGPTNDFHGLHVAWDAEYLYVAASGSFDSAGNAVNIYVDKDFGAGTGVVDFSTITGGSVGDHLRKTVDMSAVAGFGADFAGSVWSLSFDPEVSALDPDGTATTMPGATLAATTGAVEFSVPWASLYPDMGGGVPPGAELAFICVIGGGGDEFLSGDTLPPVGSVLAPDAVFPLIVDGDGR